MRRIPELDSLRAIAAIAVVGLHAGILAPSARFALLQMWGATAVDLFFVISGYLITTIILQEGRSRGFLLAFYARRSLRIWPIYYLALLAFVALNSFLPSPFEMQGLAYYLTYTQNIQHYWFASPPAFCKAFAHTWSLAVEEQFYLLWPALLLCVGRRGLVPLSLALVALAVVARGGLQLDSQLLLTRCDGLALGALLACWLQYAANRPRQLARIPAVCATLATLCMAYLTYVTVAPGRSASELQASATELGPWAWSLALLVVNVFFVAMVGLCATRSGCMALGLLRLRPLRYLGQISYGLYLYHNLIFALVQKVAGRRELSGAMVLGALGATLAAAVISWEFLERPLLRLKGRLAYGTNPAPLVVPGERGFGPASALVAPAAVGQAP
jgi:peptidoglycan/LPS O-acetylase OafA/YrhL